MKFTDFSKALSHISVAAERLKRFEDLSDAEILEFQRMLWDAFGNFRAACNTPKLPNEIKLRLLRAVEAIKRSCKNTQPDNPAAISWIITISKSETLDDELLEFLWASKEANEYITVTHGFCADVDEPSKKPAAKSKGGRPAKYPPEVAKDCMNMVNDFKQQNSRKRCNDADIGNHALKCIEVVPEAITEKIADLNDVSPEELGKIIREAAKCPIG